MESLDTRFISVLLVVTLRNANKHFWLTGKAHDYHDNALHLFIKLE
jgi:hypothetical protein